MSFDEVIDTADERFSAMSELPVARSERIGVRMAMGLGPPTVRA
jgi:hypothetical protein